MRFFRRQAEYIGPFLRVKTDAFDSPMDYDVIIIGAGMSGLGAGIRLAHYGRKVLICERHTLVGGLNSWYRRHGRDFDVGLHAMTNVAPPTAKSAPLNRLLRQLRLNYADLALQPQGHSAIEFPGARLRFGNDVRELEAAVAQRFPDQLAGLRRLIERVQAFDAFSLTPQTGTARALLQECLTEPLLAEMLLCPLMYYGSAVPDDMDLAQFCIMFRSIFLEGFGRPAGGVRRLLDLLAARYRECGGELRMNCGVRQLEVHDGHVAGVVLDDGSRLSAGAVLSSAGFVETLQLCAPPPAEAATHPVGQLAFVETIFVLDRPPAEFGFEASILFFSDTPALRFARPTGLVDHTSGVVCAPGNFAAAPGAAPDTVLRLTHLANYEPWLALPAAAYRESKAQLVAQETRILARFLPGAEQHIVCTDAFTPRTVARYTGHLHGAIYGSPAKVRDGVTPVRGLVVCGTDQGFLGIVGALMSGVSMANLHLLK